MEVWIVIALAGILIEGATQAKITEANAQAQSIEIEANAKAKAIKTVQAAYA